MEETVRLQIIEKAKNYGYKSAKIQLALVKDINIWKIVMGKIFLDICNPKENHTHLKEENFALEDIWITFDYFEKFMNYLGRVYSGDVFKDGKTEITDELLFKFGDYKLCFVGNFPSKELRFQSSQDGKNHYGVDYSFYYQDYAINSSVAAERYPELDLTGAEIPLKSMFEALNYFWGTRYEEHTSLSHYCSIYLPIFEAKIESFEIRDKEVSIKITANEDRTKLEELSIGFIAKDTSGKDYRKKYVLQKNVLDVKLEFNPNQIYAYLYLKKKKIDECDYYNYQQPRVVLTNRTIDPSFIGRKEIEIRLLDENILGNLPPQIQSLLLDSETAFNSGLYRAAAIMFRSAIEEGITLLLKQIGKEDELQNNKMEIGLDKKINLICEYMPTFKQAKGEFKDVKWFGDKSVHEANMPINEHDIIDNLEPKIRLILAKFVEEFKK